MASLPLWKGLLLEPLLKESWVEYQKAFKNVMEWMGEHYDFDPYGWKWRHQFAGRFDIESDEPVDLGSQQIKRHALRPI